MLLHIDTYLKGGKGTKHVQKCSVYVIRFDKKVSKICIQQCSI